MMSEYAVLSAIILFIVGVSYVVYESTKSHNKHSANH